jgi:hypothetical protein
MVEAVVNLAELGVRPARQDIDLKGNPYFPYQRRPLDDTLQTALTRRCTGEDPRMVLLVGDAMAGKSRTGANAVTKHPQMRGRALLVPQRDAHLASVAELAPSAGAVIWLDNLNKYTSGVARGMMRGWQAHRKLLVIATLREESMSDYQAVEDAIADAGLVEQIPIPSEWSIADQQILIRMEPAIRGKVAAGLSLGEVLGAAEALRSRLATAQPFQQALARTIIDWARTGLTGGIDGETAARVWSAYLRPKDQLLLQTRTPSEVQAEFDQALEWVRQPLPDTATTMVRLDRGGTLIPDDYLVAHPISDDIPTRLWEAAIERSRRSNTRPYQLARAAEKAGQEQIYRQAREIIEDRRWRASESMW